MSLDGFIADEYGGVDWMQGDSDRNEEGTYADFERTVGAVVMGYNTYRQIVDELSTDKWPYKDKITYVLTEEDLDDMENIRFGRAELGELVPDLKYDKGRDIWICGGASIVNQCLFHDVIDEYRITIIPTILGKGTRLFADNNEEHKLKLIKHEIYNGMVELTYHKR
jgi:dihydrofolate reductase